MNYQELVPGKTLSECVECFWTMESAAGTAREARAHEPVRILPDGCMELILNFGDVFRRYYGRGQVETQPREFVVGQMSAPVMIQPGGRVELLGVRFRPAGAARFFAPPAAELAGRMERLQDVAAGLHRELHNELAGAKSLAERATRVGKVLERVASRSEKNGNLGKAARWIEQHGGNVSVSLLAKEMGISARQLERHFEAEVGIGPKLLCRILRFQHVFRAVEELPEANWAAIAYECGYTDQSHLNRDFREFAGTTPPALFSRLDEMTERFTRKNRGWR